MVFEELDICGKHSSELGTVLLHKVKQVILLLNLDKIRVFERRRFLGILVDLDLSTHNAALEVENALNRG